MNYNWSNAPVKLTKWQKSIDYVMFIDENGNNGKILNIYNKLLNGESISNDEKYFTITGCIFDKSNYAFMRNKIRKLKDKYWNNGYYIDNKTNESKYVCLHSRDIRRHDGPFKDSIINYNEFINDLSDTLDIVNCKIISITINLVDYAKGKYLEPIYEKAFDLLLERYIYAVDNKKKGIIMLESRGKNEDKVLLNHISEIILNKGTEHIKSKELSQKILGVYFNPKWYSGYSSTYSGLEIADLFSYPIHQHIKYNKKNKAFDIIEKKINCYPNYINKGIKVFPKEKDE